MFIYINERQVKWKIRVFLIHQLILKKKIGYRIVKESNKLRYSKDNDDSFYKYIKNIKYKIW